MFNSTITPVSGSTIKTLNQIGNLDEDYTLEFNIEKFKIDA